MALAMSVILNLALFFAWHVLWPQGWSGRIEWPAAIVGLAAAVALFRFKRGIMETVGAAAVAGLALGAAGLVP